MLKNLEGPALLQLLNYYNDIWATSCIPPSWKHAHVIPIPKRGKTPFTLNNFRPIALTSAVGKVLERMVQRRLVWLLESTSALPDHLCAYRKRRTTAAALLTLSAKLQQAFADRKLSLVLFLDAKQAFDNLSHQSIHDALTRHQVKVSGQLSTTRLITKGVPQGGVLSPILFNLALADIHCDLPDTSVTPNFLIYADDICVTFTGHFRSRLQSSAQAILDHLANKLALKGLELSPSKSAALPVTSPGRHLPNGYPSLTLGNIPVPSVRHAKYLGVHFDSRLLWNHQVNHLVSTCRPLLNILKRMGGRSWGNHPRSLLLLYKALIQSRLAYALPYIDPSPTGWRQLNRLHRSGLRVALGLPSFSNVNDTLIEASALTLEHQAGVCALRTLIRLHQAGTASSILTSLKKCPDTAPDTLALKLPSQLPNKTHYLPQHFPSWREFFPHVRLDIPGLRSKKAYSTDVMKAKALDHIHTVYQHALHVYTDGSICHQTNTASSAYVIRSHHHRWAVKLRGPCPSSTTAELCAILHASIAIAPFQADRVVILTDSATSLRRLVNIDDTSVLVRSIRRTISSAAGQGTNITLQWIPSHVGIPGNEEADALANFAHTSRVATFPLPPQIQPHRIVASLLPSPSLVSRLRPTHQREPLPTRHYNRAITTALHRLRSGSSLTASSLFKYNLSTSPYCPHCPNQEETVHHIFVNCPAYQSQRNQHLPFLTNSTISLEDYLYHGSTTAVRRQRTASIASFLKDANLHLCI
ncbi:uncharacterized protein LOC135392442 [Ornithodoros turicata]|uniref:uncharacterized protein LOC135392442 n=1 Tax=Ornithodoros turicata TaxID=34597 RepID=UPI0031399275